MRSAGYTLIELLIVMLIMSIIGVAGYVSYKEFAANQVTNKALGQVQTLLRLAQSNATSSTLCNNNQNVGPWSLIFNQGNVGLACGPVGVQKTYTLENVQIDRVLCGTTEVNLPLVFTYSNGSGTLTFSSSCLDPTVWTFTLLNTRNNIPKNFKISQGGAINVE